jgi:cation diffusion facilitator CzcD-associated flavoprotein CzcO
MAGVVGMSAGAGCPSNETLDWIIIGGGVHGVHVAVRLIGEAGVRPERLRIVDPAPTLLDTWRRCTANTGMVYLRSPAVHHLDVDPWSLLRFAGANTRGRGAAKGMFAPPYDRPALDLFADHCDDVVGRYGLDALVVRGRVSGAHPSPDGVRVHVGDGRTLDARRVVIAVGAADQPHWPDWAGPLRDMGASVHHIFDAGFRLDPEAWPSRVAVVGAGITGAQAALALARSGRAVILAARHALREHQFDSDPGWVGPKNMRRFSATTDLSARRRLILEARHTGSLPPDVHRDLHDAIRSGHVTFQRGEVSARAGGGGGVDLLVGGTSSPVDALLLATGFERRRPGGAWVARLIEDYGLPCAGCGYPVVDAQLRWHPRIFVTGPLAELEIGPVSRNIVGARRAGDRIAPVARRS